MTTAALVALLVDLGVEVLRALVKRKLGRKQLPEPILCDKEVSESGEA